MSCSGGLEGITGVLTGCCWCWKFVVCGTGDLDCTPTEDGIAGFGSWSIVDVKTLCENSNLTLRKTTPEVALGILCSAGCCSLTTSGFFGFCAGVVFGVSCFGLCC